MVDLEQIRLLESKVTRMIDHVKKVTEENISLKKSVDSYQKQIEELEVIIEHFKDDQSQIEDSILSALDRLNQFEDALEITLSREKDVPSQEAKPSYDPEAPSGSSLEGTSEPAGEDGSGGELDIF